MKLIIRILTLVYRYTTAFIVLGSPLFFIPTQNFAPDVTYYVIMTSAIVLAFLSYSIVAIVTHAWQPISRFEFLAYTSFIVAVLLSTVFSRDLFSSLFGYAVNPFTAASLAALPVVMYLVRSLPTTLRDKLKQGMLLILGVSAFFFITSFMLQGKFAEVISQVFSGFSGTLSLVTYIGLFILALLAYLKRSSLHIKHKTPIILGGLVFVVVLGTLAYQGDTRPGIVNSFVVAKQVLVNHGVFGIGAGDYVQAWQLYRPENVIASPFFSIDFSQASGTLTTFLSTIGIVGALAFLFLTLGACVATYRLYRTAHEPQEKLVTGFLALLLFYFALLSVVVPLSYAMLVLWMVIAGFGVAKMPLNEYHPHKKFAYVLIPVLILLSIHAHLTLNKARALQVYVSAEKLIALQGPTDEVEALLDETTKIFAFDGFYRAKVEYAIARERLIVSSSDMKQEEMKTLYLAKAQYAVDAGLDAVRANPNNFQNYVSLGRAYELAIPFDRAAGFDNAKKSYQEAVRLYPSNPYLYVMLARLEASAGSKEEVRAQLTEALKKKQNFADALYLMSQLEVSEQRLDEALEYAISAVNAAPNDPNVYIQAGLLFYAKKDYGNAVTALDKALSLDQTNANTAYFLALALRDGGRTDIAKQIGEELLKRNPGNADLETFLESLEENVPQTATSTKK